MIDIENHKIIDIIESRKDSDVAAWLKTLPNLENAIKFIKRIMYGRCKFDTLRNKILIDERYN